MTERGAMDCDGLRDVAAELALGVLTGRERARAIAHLEGCDPCAEHVRQLAITGEQLLELLPGVEPPAGFETRVISGLGVTDPPRAQPRARRLPPIRRSTGERRSPRTRRALAAAAVAALAVAGATAGWELHASRPSPAASPAGAPLHAATLLTASGHPAGKIFLYSGRSPWLYMAVDDGSGDGAVACQLQTRGGRVITIGSIRLKDGYGHWGGPLPLPASDVAAARLTTPTGAVLATATFTAAG